MLHVPANIHYDNANTLDRDENNSVAHHSYRYQKDLPSFLQQKAGQDGKKEKIEYQPYFNRAP